MEITPTLILIQKGNQDYLPVSAGVISADEIEDKAYRAVRLLKGDISPEEYSLYEFQKGGGFDVKKRRPPGTGAEAMRLPVPRQQRNEVAV